MPRRTPVPRIVSWDTWPHEFCSVASLALRWNEAPHTIRKWVRAGRFDVYRFGHRSVRVTAASARDFEERCRLDVSRETPIERTA